MLILHNVICQLYCNQIGKKNLLYQVIESFYKNIGLNKCIWIKMLNVYSILTKEANGSAELKEMTRKTYWQFRKSIFKP